MTPDNSSINLRDFYDEVPFDGDVIDSIAQTYSQQGQALLKLSKNFSRPQYQLALSLMYQCRGHVIISGMGKSGHIGRKIAATLASTGTPSFFIHPAEAFHGDLGMITPDDVVVLISNSGESDEVLQLIPSLKSFNNRIIAITGGTQSTLGKNADAILEVMMSEESCPNNLAPTTSTTLTLAIGDALAVALMHKRHFQPNDFARYHPGGSLGRRLLTRLKDVMNTELTTVDLQSNLRDVIMAMSAGKHGIAVVMQDQQLQGVVTDGDLRRAMSRTDFSLDDISAKDVMTLSPITLPENSMLSEAEELMRSKQIKQVLVLNNASKPVGIVEFFD